MTQCEKLSTAPGVRVARRPTVKSSARDAEDAGSSPVGHPNHRPSRARDGVCHAQARTRGRRCAAPVAVGTVCWRHGASALRAPWTVTATGGELVAWSDRGDRESRRQALPIRPWAAVELARRGVITRGLFLGATRGFARLLRRMHRAGVRVELESGGLVQAYRFEVPA